MVVIVNVSRPADGRPGMERSTRLHHSSDNHLIILHCNEDLFVLQNLLTLTTHVVLLTPQHGAMRLHHVLNLIV